MIPKAKKRSREVRVTRERRRAGGPNAGHGWAARQARGEGRAKPKKVLTEKKSKARAAALALKRRLIRTPGERSRYALKAGYLKRWGGWGWQWAEKPWKSR